MRLHWTSLLLTALGLAGCPQPVEPEPDAAAPPAQPTPPPMPPPPPSTAAQGEVFPGVVNLDRPAAAEVGEWQTGALCPGCDIVMISVCSLRGDHLGAYGDDRGLTPAIDGLANRSIRFTRAYAGGNFTLGSLSTMLTGNFGSTTGVLNWGRGLPDQFRTLPEVLGVYGYRTGGFSVDAATGFRPDYGLDKGFQRMAIIEPPRDTPDGRHRTDPIGAGGATAAPMAEWIASTPKERPLFALLHTRSAHFPFVVSTDGMDEDTTGVRKALWEEGAGARNSDRAMPGRAGGQMRPGLVASGELAIQNTVRRAGTRGVAVWNETYAESVARMDKDIAAALAAIKARGRPTVIVLIGDHGETLDDNNELLHGAGFFESVARVPLLISVPGVEPRTSDALVSQVDLLPTLTNLVGVTPPSGIDGESLVPVITRASSAIRSTALLEGDPSWTGDGELPGAVISPPWTLLRQTFPCTPGEQHKRPPPPPGAPLGEPLMYTCLFNLDDDPAQASNLADTNPETVTRLNRRWEAFRAARKGRSVPRDLRLDPSMIEMLQRTGYDFRSEAQ